MRRQNSNGRGLQRSPTSSRSSLQGGSGTSEAQGFFGNAMKFWTSAQDQLKSLESQLSNQVQMNIGLYILSDEGGPLQSSSDVHAFGVCSRNLSNSLARATHNFPERILLGLFMLLLVMGSQSHPHLCLELV